MSSFVKFALEYVLGTLAIAVAWIIWCAVMFYKEQIKK